METLTTFLSPITVETILSLSTFLKYAPRFKQDILLAQDAKWPVHVAPPELPYSVATLLSNLCDLSKDEVEKLWSYLKECIWNLDEQERKIDEQFKLHGKDLSYDVLYPPHNYCTNTSICDRASKGRKLQKVDQTQGVLYTLNKGVCPVWIVRYQCEGPGCQTSYYHNFSVRNGTRTYYGNELPDIIQVGEHQFVEKQVIALWITDINISAKSFTNCARTYQAALGCHSNLPLSWPIKASLKGDHVQIGFIVLSLLEDHLERGVVLSVPHGGEQADRFTAALIERNNRIKICGQQEITHRCKKCTRIYEGNGDTSSKSVWVAVMDGITIGHPRCGFHNCHIPLTSIRDRFCVVHRSLHEVCAVVNCNQPTVTDKMTCAIPEHQEVEHVRNLRGQSRFQLQSRLKRARVSHLNDAIAEDVDPQTLLDDEDEDFDLSPNLIHGTVDGQSDPRGEAPSVLPSKKIKAQFGRRRTHNEQILVAPCGMILARETFFGAEAISTCAEFIKRTFRINGHIPNHIFFDNNCSLAKHVKNDPYFTNIGLTVDVFHFNCKHSTRDQFCQENCNPAIFKELHGENGKAWFFNSSIAEQTNVWLGGFHAILREMLPVKYNFFLDQMIILRNRLTHAKLQEGGYCPINI